MLSFLINPPLEFPHALFISAIENSISSTFKQHILSWYSSWKVKMHTTIIFNQKTLLDLEWVHSYLTRKMYCNMMLLEIPWNGMENSLWRSKSLKGILRSFHFSILIAIYQAQNFTSAFPLHEKIKRNDQVLKMLAVSILSPSKF